jgi:acyl-coenzyme A synthetase/AMP-(fatty) acid ligase
MLETEELANRVAHFLMGQVQIKDTIALMMSNRFELVAFWLGVGKVGCSCALLNTNARGLTLEHALQVSTTSSKSKLFVIERDLHDQLPPDQLATLAAQGTTVLVWEDLVSTVLSTMSPLRPSRSLRAGVTER